MYTTAPEITNDTTVGTVVTGATATPTTTTISTPTQTASPTSKSTIRVTPTPTPKIKEFVQKPLSIYGYGPANSTVNLTGFGVSEVTQSDTNGYFEFTKIYAYSVFYPELCITANDDNNLTTYPICIPPLLKERIIPSNVGPIFLPPTVSIADTVKGITVPNSEIQVYISKMGKYSLPMYVTKSNEEGKYDFLFFPPIENSDYEFFLVNKVDDNFSGRSNLISFSTNSTLKQVIQETKSIYLSNKFSLLIVLEVLIIIILAILLLNYVTRRNSK